MKNLLLGLFGLLCLSAYSAPTIENEFFEPLTFEDVGISIVKNDVSDIAITLNALPTPEYFTCSNVDVDFVPELDLATTSPGISAVMYRPDFYGLNNTLNYNFVPELDLATTSPGISAVMYRPYLSSYNFNYLSSIYRPHKINCRSHKTDNTYLLSVCNSRLPAIYPIFYFG